MGASAYMASKLSGERLADRPFDLHRQIAPAVRHAIAGVFGADVVAADHRAAPVADQELAMIAKRQAQAARRTEHPHLAARFLQRQEKVAGSPSEPKPS